MPNYEKRCAKDFEEATAAIRGIAFNAKIPVLSMIAILELTKHDLLSSPRLISMKTEDVKRFFAAVQKKADETHTSKGVS